MTTLDHILTTLTTPCQIFLTYKFDISAQMDTKIEKIPVMKYVMHVPRMCLTRHYRLNYFLTVVTGENVSALALTGMIESSFKYNPIREDIKRREHTIITITSENKFTKLTPDERRWMLQILDNERKGITTYRPGVVRYNDKFVYKM